ncbi:MAG: sortase [Catenulispora sp.]|nr:sortase [Catenulispora sp.]
MSAPTTSPAAGDTEDPSQGSATAAKVPAGTETDTGTAEQGADGTPAPSSPAAAATGSATEPVPGRAAERRPASRAGRGLRITRTAAASASLLSGLLLGFGLYTFGLTGLQEQHSQANLYRVLDKQLSQATAPLGPAADGAPLAILDIPAVGLRQTVVVEGSTGADLARGPGHVRDTVLPGQNGVSVLMGRRGTFGAPFARLDKLRPGDKIDVTTGQGSFSYTVSTPAQGTPVIDGFQNRLVLVTGDSTWIPTHAVYLGAHLDGDPAPAGSKRVRRGDLDKPLVSDADVWPALQLWGLALVVAVALTVWLASVWDRRAVYLSTVPVLAALLWCVYENAALLLPNLY